MCCVITICVPPDVPKMTDGGWSGLSATTSMVVPRSPGAASGCAVVSFETMSVIVAPGLCR